MRPVMSEQRSIADKLKSLVGLLVHQNKQLVNVNTMDHTGLFHGFTAGGGSAKAMHADGHEDRRSMGCDVQNIANDGVFGDLDHSHNLRYKIEQQYYTL